MSKNKTGIKRKESRIDIIKLFVGFSLIGLVYAFLTAYMSGGDTIRNALFWNGGFSDHFMDFYNTMRDSRDLSWLYQRNIIYPPLSILMMYFFTQLIPAESMPELFTDRYDMQLDPYASTVFFLFACLSMLLIALCVERYLANREIGLERLFVALFCIVSFPVIYCVERGNTSILAAGCCAFFVFFRNSESKAVREFSYIMLAIGAGLKMFPALFGILLIYDKKYFAAFRTVVYGVLLLVVPYILINLMAPAEGGLYEYFASSEEEWFHSDGTLVSFDGSLGRFAQNLLRWVDKKSYFTYNSTSIMNVFYFLYACAVLPPQYAQLGGLGAFLVTELIAFVLGFFCKKEWQKVFICTYLMLNVHSVAMHYTLVYMIPALAVFLAESRGEKKQKLNVAYLALFAVQFVTLPLHCFRRMQLWYSLWAYFFEMLGPTNFNKMISCPAFQLMALIVFIDIVVRAVSEARQKKKIESSIKVRKARSAV